MGAVPRCCSQAASPAQSGRGKDRFLFQRGRRVAEGQAFVQILLQKLMDSTQPFILHHMYEFMEHQPPVFPAIGPDENSVAQRETGGLGCEQVGCAGGSS